MTLAKPLTLERPRMKQRIIELVLADKSDAEVASAISTKRSTISRQAITAFRKRHQDVLKPAVESMIVAAVQHAVATKEARLADLQFLRDRTMAVIERREYGIEAEDIKIAANGDTVRVLRYDAGLVAQFRGVLADAAEEMGERSKVAIDARNQTFNYIELVGQLGE